MPFLIRPIRLLPHAMRCDEQLWHIPQRPLSRSLRQNPSLDLRTQLRQEYGRSMRDEAGPFKITRFEAIRPNECYSLK